MAIYIVIAILPVFLSLLFKNKQKRISDIMFFVFSILIGLRDFSVGSDTNQYEFLYQYIGQKSITVWSYFLDRGTEPLFIVYNKVCSIFSSNNYRFYIIVSAIVFSYGLYQAIKLYSKQQWLSWFLFISFGYIAYGMNLIRASLALTFGLLTLRFWINDNFEGKRAKSNFVLGCLAATLMHYTAVVYLGLAPLYKIREKYKRGYSIILISFCAIGFFFGNQIAQFMAGIIYSKKVYEFESFGGWGLLLIVLTIRVLNEFFVKQCDKDRKYEITNYLLEIALVFQIMARGFNLWSRVAEFVFIPAIILMADLFSKYRFSANSRRIFNFTLVVVMMLFFIFNLSKTGAGIVPYVFMT